MECYNITGMNEYLLCVEIKDLVVYKCFYVDVFGECVVVKFIIIMVVMDLFKDEW